MMESIKSRLAALENAVRGKPIPTEREFWESWNDFDPLTKSLYEATAELRLWETETDNHSKKYFEACSKFLIDAGLATEGESIPAVVEKLEALNVEI